jgi:hypothetical protein
VGEAELRAALYQALGDRTEAAVWQERARALKQSQKDEA